MVPALFKLFHKIEEEKKTSKFTVQDLYHPDIKPDKDTTKKEETIGQRLR